jgi:hypothetical protein
MLRKYFTDIPTTILEKRAKKPKIRVSKKTSTRHNREKPSARRFLLYGTGRVSDHILRSKP